MDKQQGIAWLKKAAAQNSKPQTRQRTQKVLNQLRKREKK